MTRDILALKVSGVLDPEAVLHVASVVMNPDFNEIAELDPLEITNLRNYTTLDILAPTGLLVISDIIKAEIKDRRTLKEGVRVTGRSASLSVEGSIHIPDLRMFDPRADISIHSNKSPEGDYYSMVAQCSFTLIPPL